MLKGGIQVSRPPGEPKATPSMPQAHTPSNHPASFLRLPKALNRVAPMPNPAGLQMPLEHPSSHPVNLPSSTSPPEESAGRPLRDTELPDRFSPMNSLIPAARPEQPSGDSLVPSGRFHMSTPTSRCQSAHAWEVPASDAWKRAADKIAGERNISEEFDVTMLLGDLNYRVDDEVEQVVDVLASSFDVSAQRHLFSLDQLHCTMTASVPHPLWMFDEPVTEDRRMPFKPTFKYRPGSAKYDPKRTPSWTDRILWRCNYSVDGSPAVLPINYSSIDDLQLSDHRPVVATLAVKLMSGGRVSPVKRDQDYQLAGTAWRTAGVSSELQDRPPHERFQKAPLLAAGMDLESRGGTLRRWLADATARLLALKTGPGIGFREADLVDEGCGPLRRNMELLNQAEADDDEGEFEDSIVLDESIPLGFDKSETAPQMKTIRSSHSVPRGRGLSVTQ